MKKQVEIIILLFFGLAFLVCLFPFVFVEAAKLQSGVTINAPSTTETEKICDDTIDNDNDGKIDANDEDCAAPTGPTAGTCGLRIMSGVPINYGQLNPGQDSAEQKVRIYNEGQTPAKIMIKGGDWISDAAGNPTISGPEVTHVTLDFFTGYDTKLPLHNNEMELVQFLGQLIPDGTDKFVSFQVRAWENVPSGSFHQEVTIDLLC